MVNKHYRIPDNIYQIIEDRDANVYRTDIDYISEAVLLLNDFLNNGKSFQSDLERKELVRDIRKTVKEELNTSRSLGLGQDMEVFRQVIREELHELEMRLRPPVEFGPDDPEWWKEEYEWKRRAWIRFHLPERDWPESMRNDRFLPNWLRRPPREEEK